jgi:hypothetical protein
MNSRAVDSPIPDVPPTAFYIRSDARLQLVSIERMITKNTDQVGAEAAESSQIASDFRAGYHGLVS